MSDWTQRVNGLQQRAESDLSALPMGAQEIAENEAATIAALVADSGITDGDELHVYRQALERAIDRDREWLHVHRAR